MRSRQLVIGSLREIGRTDFGKFALIQAMFAVASMWMAIFVLELEQAPGRREKNNFYSPLPPKAKDAILVFK